MCTAAGGRGAASGLVVKGRLCSMLTVMLGGDLDVVVGFRVGITVGVNVRVRVGAATPREQSHSKCESRHPLANSKVYFWGYDQSTLQPLSQAYPYTEH